MTGVAMEILKVACTVSSMFMNLSPTPSMYRIYESKSCGEVQVLPLLSLWVNLHVWSLYGYLSENIFPLFVTVASGCALAIGYLGVFYQFTHERPRVRKLVLGALVWNVTILVAAFSGSEYLGITHLSKANTSNWIGYLATTTSVALYASPFATLVHVIRTKSVATIPIEMVVVGTLTNTIWMVYGILTSDRVVAITNVICVVFGCVQIGVYVVVQCQRSGMHDTTAHAKKDSMRYSTIELDCSSIPVAEGAGAHAFQALQSPV